MDTFIFKTKKTSSKVVNLKCLHVNVQFFLIVEKKKMKTLHNKY